MRFWLRMIPIALAAVSIGRADSLLTQEVSVFSSDCIQPVACGSYSYSFDLQQFDPSLGTLNSVIWSYSDDQLLHWGFNDTVCSSSFPPQQCGQPFDVTIVNANSGPLIGDLSTTTVVERIASCCFQISNGPIGQGATFAASGITQPDGFVGVGTISLGFVGSGSATNTSSSGVTPAFPFAEAVSEENRATLDITYDYTAVPEPPQIWMLVGAAAVLIVGNYSGGKER